MRIFALIFLAFGVLAIIACNGAQDEPTPNIGATVEARIQATQETEASIDATVQARVAATVAAEASIEATVTARMEATKAAEPTPTPTPTLQPSPTPAPLPPTPTPLLARAVYPSLTGDLEEYAARHAGGPGAIYVGDLTQLVGPAPGYGLGDADEYVPLYAIEQHRWIYESEYYQSLLDKAKLANPTPLSSQGAKIEILHACINRATLPCLLIQEYWARNLEARTNGQLKLVVSSFPELGIAGPDTLELVADGILSMAAVYSSYIAGQLPIAEAQSLWGIYPDHQTAFESVTKTLPSSDAVLTEAAHGGIVINHNWFLGEDFFFFSNKPLRTLEDFKDLKTRSNSAALSDWIEGMDADAQFIAFSEVYTVLKREVS